MTIYRIYKITNDIDDKVYIGVTNNTCRFAYNRIVSSANTNPTTSIHFDMIRNILSENSTILNENFHYEMREHYKYTVLAEKKTKKDALVFAQNEIDKLPKSVIVNERTVYPRLSKKEYNKLYSEDYREIHKNDPEFMEKKRVADRTYYHKKMQDPEFVEKERIRATNKNKRKRQDPEYKKYESELKSKWVKKVMQDPEQRKKINERRKEKYHENMEKIKADPIRYEEYKRKRRESTRKYRAKKRLKSK